MVQKLSIKMAILYGTIIIITIMSINIILVKNYEARQFQKNELEFLTFSSIISRLVRDEMPDTYEIRQILDEYAQNINGRILILNDNGVVIGDVYKTYLGRMVTNEQIRKSINEKRETKKYYRSDEEYFMMLTTPILQLNEVVGVVLISTSVVHIKNDVGNLTNQAFVISAIAIIIALILLLVIGRYILKPIRILTSASENILAGKLDTKVKVRRKDEIGRLALTFNKMSEELCRIDQNRRVFISNVSHELKTPIAVIKALIESLINGENDIETYNEYLSDVNGELDRLSTLVKSLLVVASLEEEKLKLEPVRIKYIIDNIIKMYEPVLKEKGITVISDCDRNVMILCDRDKIKRVLINLIDNSIKYGRVNGHIEIFCKNVSRKTIFKIKDDGCGISEDDLPYIFNNFYRGDKARKSDTGSNGVGLFIVKRIIEIHNWTINVDSILGEGTKFTIVIP